MLFGHQQPHKIPNPPNAISLQIMEYVKKKAQTNKSTEKKNKSKTKQPKINQQFWIVKCHNDAKVCQRNLTELNEWAKKGK